MNPVVGAFEEAAANFVSIATSNYPDQVVRSIDLIVETFQRGHKLLVFGNGGSAADAQHICAELVGRFSLDRPGLPAMVLGTDAATTTAWCNDHDFESLFERQIQSFGRPGDLAWGISTSGNSPNVVAALRRARELGLKTLGLTGEGGGAMAEFCDLLLAPPVKATPRVQEVHLVTYHSICAQVEERLFGAARDL